MECSECSAGLVTFEIPPEFREYLPGEEQAAGLCTRCLSLEPVTGSVPGSLAFEEVSDAFPTNPDAALPMALLIGLLSNLALYRSEISSLLASVERAGTDPLLVLDRLATDPAVETDIDLRGRRRQLEQLL